MGWLQLGLAAYSAYQGSKKKGARIEGPSQYQTEGYFNYDEDLGYIGPGGKRTEYSDRMAFDSLKQLYERDPGFSEEELSSIYQSSADEIDLGTQAQLRGVNRAAAQTGAWGSGGRRSSLASASERGARSKAGLQFKTKSMGAMVALEDRYRRIAALQGYADPRIAMMQGEHGRRLNFIQNADQLRAGAQKFNIAQNTGTDIYGPMLEAAGTYYLGTR